MVVFLGFSLYGNRQGILWGSEMSVDKKRLCIKKWMIVCFVIICDHILVPKETLEVSLYGLTLSEEEPGFFQRVGRC